MADQEQQYESLENDKSLQCLRIELNANQTIFLYYKVYPKAGSKRFPQERTAIVFYFESEIIDQHILKTYLGLAGQIDKIELGSYVNQRGYKTKGKIVSFAIVKYIDEDNLTELLNHKKMQIKVNDFIENKRNRKLQLKYDPIKEEDWEEADEEDEEDSEGFTKVNKNAQNKIKTKSGLSFKVHKEGDDEDEDNKKNKKSKSNNFYNFQLLDKKRKMYEDLKSLFEQDREAVDNKKANKNKKLKL